MNTDETAEEAINRLGSSRPFCAMADHRPGSRDDHAVMFLAGMTAFADVYQLKIGAVFVTGPEIRSWLFTHGWRPTDEVGTDDIGSGRTWRKDGGPGIKVYEHDTGAGIESALEWMSVHNGTSPREILDWISGQRSTTGVS